MITRDLLMAIKSNHTDAIVRLIKCIDLKEDIENKKTSIELLSSLGYWSCVEAIARDKRTDAADTARYGSALYYAVCEDRVETARILLEAGASKKWCNSSNGDRCLHIAIRKNNRPMIALLLFFGFDLKERNTHEQTALQLAESLNVDSLNEGWKMYYDLTTLRMALPVVVQSMRQYKSAFNKIPYACSELIVSFLSPQAVALKETVKSAQCSIIKVSVGCVLFSYEYQSCFDMFRRRSSESKELVSELRTALKTNDASIKSIGSAVDTFLKKTNGKKRMALDLLFKYHLVREENKAVISCVPSSLKKG
jgi:hypothetical protein